ncbi:MAG: hypothetical protein DRR42_07155 [Gammaproteobacteria bacterium]|nr:MAG: hypothetical protein DRR42_07155 [Gammaproteobacteria bacterium]
MNPRLSLTFLLVSLLFGCATGTQVDESTIFSTLTGTWDTEDPATCESYRTISFSKNRKTMIATNPNIGYASETDGRKTFIYDVLEVRETTIRVALENEPRLDANGNPVVWIVKLLDENTFCWGRDDWPASGCTPRRMRCEI